MDGEAPDALVGDDSIRVFDPQGGILKGRAALEERFQTRIIKRYPGEGEGLQMREGEGQELSRGTK